MVIYPPNKPWSVRGCLPHDSVVCSSHDYRNLVRRSLMSGAEKPDESSFAFLAIVESIIPGAILGTKTLFGH